jgi:hypothetical protein
MAVIIIIAIIIIISTFEINTAPIGFSMSDSNPKHLSRGLMPYRGEVCALQ